MVLAWLTLAMFLLLVMTCFMSPFFESSRISQEEELTGPITLDEAQEVADYIHDREQV